MKLQERIDSLKIIANDISFCNRCELCDSRDHTCPGNYMLSRDSKRFKYMLIGEAPGRQEDESGKVFVGKAGQLLKEAIQTIELKDFFIANILKCRPPENRDPLPEEIEQCRDWLIDQIDATSPKVIICIGDVAHKALTKWFVDLAQWEELKPHVKIEKIYHPSYILRNGGKNKPIYYEWLESIKTIKEKWSHL